MGKAFRSTKGVPLAERTRLERWRGEQLPLSFNDQPQRQTHPAEPIIRLALIEGDYRFWLRRAWGSGPSIAWVGLNPSTADGKADDPTMRAEIGFSFRLGFGSLVKVNIYPFRAADPAELKRWLKKWRGDFGGAGPQPSARAFYRNWDIAATEIRKCDMVLAAWGDGADAWDVEGFVHHVEANDPITDAAQPRQRHTGEFARDWYCLAKTASGSPRHTLARGHHFIPRDAQPTLWLASPARAATIAESTNV